MELSNDLLKLSSKEIETIKLLADGKRMPEIANDLGISRRTVEQRILAIREKLGAKTPEQAVAISVRSAIIA
jgi:DNA-binding CsgD family transcriptional regulator